MTQCHCEQKKKTNQPRKIDVSNSLYTTWRNFLHLKSEILPSRLDSSDCCCEREWKKKRMLWLCAISKVTTSAATFEYLKFACVTQLLQTTVWRKADERKAVKVAKNLSTFIAITIPLSISLPPEWNAAKEKNAHLNCKKLNA